MSASLRVRELTCALDGGPVVEKLEFDVPAGAQCAVVGVNGSGKTTLLRTLAGILSPASGAVLIDDKSVHSLRNNKRARKIAFVGQEESLQPDLTVFESVSLGRLPHIKPWEMGSQRTNELVEKALQQTGISGLARRLCGELSGGQRRLTLVARALVQDTDVIILDEPANHLDVRHQLELLAVLRRSEKTIICSMHDLDLARAHFGHVVVLRPGEMVSAGSTGQILTPATISENFGVKALVVKPTGCLHEHLVIDAIDWVTESRNE